MKAKKALQFLDRRILSSASSLVLLLAMAIPAVVPAYASAANLTTRSISLSSSVKSATNVTYEVKFTTVQAAGQFVLEFCDDSPIVGQTCTAPAGFSAAGVSSTTGGATASELNSAANEIDVTDTMGAAANVDVVLTGLTNPNYATGSTSGFYARILTYASATSLTSFTDTTPQAYLDQGGVAMGITDGTNISASVLESMTFCVAGNTINQDCDKSTGTLNPPNLTLGETVGTTQALSTSALSTGSIYTQLSTNAVGGAVVNLKSDATSCGGLVLVGGPANNCYIKPASAVSGSQTAGGAGAAAGYAYFGLEVLAASTATSGDTTATGTLEPVSGSNYGATVYNMNFASNNSTGVTSTYGDPILDTNSAPVNNQNQTLTFGASIDNNTPAGNYQANLSLIATGTY